MRRSGVRFLFPAPVDSRTYTNSELVYLYRASSGLAPDNGSPPEHDNLAFRSTAFGQCDFCNLCFFGNSELKSIYSLKAKVRSAPKPAVDAHRTPTPHFLKWVPPRPLVLCFAQTIPKFWESLSKVRRLASVRMVRMVRGIVNRSGLGWTR